MTWTPPATWTAPAANAVFFNAQIRDNLLALTEPISWVPTISATTTPPTVSSATGYAIMAGQWCFFEFTAVLNAPGSGIYTLALPAPALIPATGKPVGQGSLRDVSTGSIYPRTLVLSSAIGMRFYDESAAALSSTAPVATAAGDVLSGHVAYLTA